MIYWYINQRQIKLIKSGLGLCNKLIKLNRVAENYQSNQIKVSGLFNLIISKSNYKTSYKLLQCKELHERLNYKIMDIKWYKYIKVSVKRLTLMTYK